MRVKVEVTVVLVITAVDAELILSVEFANPELFVIKQVLADEAEVIPAVVKAVAPETVIVPDCKFKAH